MTIAQPQHLWVLFLVPALGVFFVWAFRKKREALLAFAEAAALPRLLKHSSPERQAAKAALVTAALLFAALAALQPRWGYHWEEVRSRGVDVYLALDVSRSMLAEDVSPSRLDRAKRKIVDFLRMAHGDRVGLIAFAGRAFVACPLTLDYGAIETLSASLDTESASWQGSAIEEAIDAAVDAIPENEKRSTALVLLTDGESLAGDPMAAAERAKKRGVTIHSMGIGKESGAPIPNAEGGGFKKDAGGDMVLTRLDEKLLKALAVTTGGSYVRSVAADEDLNELFNDIHKGTEDIEQGSGKQKKLEERYQWPLALAILLLFFELVFPEAPPEKATGRRRLPWRRKEAAAALVLALMVSSTARASSSNTDLAQGETLYEKGDYDGALKHFLDAEVEDPKSPGLKYNLANTYYKLGKFEEAKKLYQAARESGEKELLPKATYNMGNTAFRKGDMDDAIRNYEEAIKLNPKDEDAKHNLAFVRREKERREQQQQQKGDKNDKNDKKDQKQDENQKADGKQSMNQEPRDKPGPEKNGPEKNGQEKKADAIPSGGDKKDEDKKKEEEKEAAAAKEKKDGKGEEEKKVADAGKMTKEEAETWLKRLREGKKKDPGNRARGETRRQNEKDW